jgi:ATP-dependent helicase/nuclease subunit A
MNTVTQPSSFLVYKASAGSGKTFNLAKTYLSICFRHFAQDKYVYRKILGITFTNKAVSEMKTRILYFLNVLSKGEDEELMVHFTGTHNPTEIAAYAAELLKLIHHDYSNFSILTIDSLFERIIRTFSVDLKLPLNHTLSWMLTC